MKKVLKVCHLQNTRGIEYLISATNVTNTVGTKNLPISITATTSGTLGTSDDNYFENRETATSHIYKVLATDTISDNDQLMVGYIAKGQAGINGTITIKAYIDKDKILISDTYPEGEVVIDGVTYYNGTPNTNKTVFTTEEWNSLNTNGISFQVKVEANEGIWVDDINGENDMLNIKNIFTNEQKSSITEINFIRMSEEEINTHVNLIDLTDSNGSGVVKGWIDNNKLYIASPGITYFPQDSSGLFVRFSALQIINFNNINTSNVTLMPGMFSGCSSLTTLDLSIFDTSNVTIINQMFYNCTNLVNVILNNFNTNSLTMMGEMFSGCSSLTTLDLSSFDTSNVTVMGDMFANDINLTTIYVGNNWSTSSVTGTQNMFNGCTSLKGGGTPQTTYDANHIDKEYARIDGGANSSTPGYLTLKTN